MSTTLSQRCEHRRSTGTIHAPAKKYAANGKSGNLLIGCGAMSAPAKSGSDAYHCCFHTIGVSTATTTANKP